MRVYIDKGVDSYINNFYISSLLIHPALDEITVLKKVNRLYESLYDLGIYGKIYSQARLKQEWIDKGYKEFICEDFHFAFQIYTTESGDEIIRIHDACHSLQYK
jgi:hypothetical protein